MKNWKLYCVSLCFSAALPWLLGGSISQGAVSITNSELSEYRGGAICEDIVPSALDTLCQDCQNDPPLASWKGCDVQTRYECIAVTSNGFRPECFAATPGCGGLQVRYDVVDCDSAHQTVPFETRGCTKLYTSSVMVPQMGGNCR